MACKPPATRIRDSETVWRYGCGVLPLPEPTARRCSRRLSRGQTEIGPSTPARPRTLTARPRLSLGPEHPQSSEHCSSSRYVPASRLRDVTPVRLQQVLTQTAILAGTPFGQPTRHLDYDTQLPLQELPDGGIYSRFHMSARIFLTIDDAPHQSMHQRRSSPSCRRSPSRTAVAEQNHHYA